MTKIGVKRIKNKLVSYCNYPQYSYLCLTWSDFSVMRMGEL